jgi:hypothetical protein
MVWTIAVGFFLVCTAGPVGAAEVESFDPDAPFQQGLTTSLLRSLLNQSFNRLEDHIELMGKLDSGGVKGDRQGRLQFKFYPEGKSKSDQQLAAEGWFQISPDGGQHNWHFRFSLPEDRKNSPLQLEGPL